MTGIGYVCGAGSGNLEVLDFHDNIYIEYSSEALMTVTELFIVLELIEKGWSEHSPNGIHLYYRCSEIGVSTTLATRPKLPEEMKHAKDNTQTLIAIHGEGGYIIAAPSYGNVNPYGEYTFMQGGPDTIMTITPEQRDGLHGLARKFDSNPVEESIAESDPVTLDSTETDEAADDIYTRADSISDDYAVAHHVVDHPVTTEPLYTKGGGKKVSQPIVTMSDMEWESPPLLFGKFNIPDIPASLLPCVFGEFADAVSRSTQTPAGLSVMLTLSTIATCVQGKSVVSPYNGYAEPLQIWTMTALQSGSRKTAVLKIITAPLTMRETEKYAEQELQIKATRTMRNVIERRIKSLSQQASKADDPCVREEIIRDIDMLIKEMPPELNAPRLFTGDVTPVGLQKLLCENDGRMSIIADEAGIFKGTTGISSNGNKDVYLQGHAGSTIKVDRAGRELTLNDPSLTFGLTVQNDVISKLTRNGKDSLRDAGLLARFLFCVPESIIGTRDVRNIYEVPDELKSLYLESVKSLLDIPYLTTEDGGIRVLGLDTEALDEWYDFSQHIENDQVPSGSLHSISDWSCKLAGATLRIAGLMHVAEFGITKDTISIGTMSNAIAMAEILIDHAKLAFDMLGSDPVVEDAKVVFKWIISNGTDCFRASELHKDLHGKFTKVDRLKAALRVLTERNIISEPILQPTGRRQKIVHYVNPSVWELVAA